jgi:predicted flap endonuclease-1-like 5' DNA nuclease
MTDAETVTVKAPVSNFEGTRAGVIFRDGEGEATEEQARRLAARGYEVAAFEEEEDTIEELSDIKGVGSARTEALGKLGIDTPAALAEADAADVADAFDKVDAETVENWQDQV